MYGRSCGALVVIAAVAVPRLAAGQPAPATRPAGDAAPAPGAEAAAPDAAAAAAPDAAAAPATTPAPDGVPAAVAVPVAPASGAADDPRGRVTSRAGFAWEPFGYLRLQYIVVQNDPNISFVGRDDGFELQNARVGVRGWLATRASFVVSIDGAVDEREQINVPEGKLRVGLRDAFVDVALAGHVSARAGFFQTVVDPDAPVSDTLREFVDRPIESRGMRATEGFQTQGLTPGRSLGAAVRLDPGRPGAPRIGFELAVQNGADEFASNNDNDKPAVSAALLVRVPRDVVESSQAVRRAALIVVAGRYNPRTVGDLPFRQDEDDLQGSAGVQVALGPVGFGGGGMVQRTTFATTGGPAQTAFGAHAQLMYRIGEAQLRGMPLAVGYRFGILDPSSLIVTDRVMEHTAAAMLAVPAYRMRVQLQLTHVLEQAARELSNSRAQLAVELAL